MVNKSKILCFIFIIFNAIVTIRVYTFYMAEDNWSVRLEKYGKELSHREQDLIQWINQNPHEAAFFRLSELEQQADISKPLIISCYRRLGYVTYQDFCRGIQEFYSGQIDSYRASTVALRDIDSMASLVKACLSVELSAIQNLQSHLDLKAFEKAVSMILQAPCTYVYGAGSGFYPAHYLVQRMHSLGLRSVLAGTDREHVMDDCMPAGPQDVFITFHYTQDHDTLQRVMDVFRQQGAFRIFISGSMSPALCRLADISMYVPRGSIRFKNSMAVPMAFSQMLLLGLELTGREQTGIALEKLDRYSKYPS